MIKRAWSPGTGAAAGSLTQPCSYRAPLRIITATCGDYHHHDHADSRPDPCPAPTRQEVGKYIAMESAKIGGFIKYVGL